VALATGQGLVATSPWREKDRLSGEKLFRERSKQNEQEEDDDEKKKVLVQGLCTLQPRTGCKRE